MTLDPGTRLKVNFPASTAMRGMLSGLLFPAEEAPGRGCHCYGFERNQAIPLWLILSSAKLEDGEEEFGCDI